MGKLAEKELFEELPDKVKLLYQAVQEIIAEDADINSIKVSDITDRAGIGKGTAYEYFDSKEEIIACGLIYSLGELTRRLQSDLEDKSSFTERLTCLLDETEKQAAERKCILRFVHLVFDAASTGKLVRNMLENRPYEKCGPLMLIRYVIARGLEAGELRTDLTADYMTYMLFTRLVAYMAYLNDDGKKGDTNQGFRKQLVTGILNEFCVLQ